MLDLYAKVRAVKGVKKAFIGSGIRYDLFDGSDYLDTVIRHHTSGRLKVAPEHTEDAVLKLMRKPPFVMFERLNADFNRICRREGLPYQLIPYFISSHPGCTERDMRRSADKVLGKLHFDLEQVQDLTPTPMTFFVGDVLHGRNPYTGEKRSMSPARRRRNAGRKATSSAANDSPATKSALPKECRLLYLSDSPILIQIGFQYAEQQVGHDQRDYDVEHLGRHESPERAAVFLRENIPETGFEADADERDVEERIAEHLGRSAGRRGFVAGEEEAEEERYRDETHHEFREALPDHPHAGALTFLLSLVRPIQRNDERRDTQQDVCDDLTMMAVCSAVSPSRAPRRYDRTRRIDRSAHPAPATSCTVSGFATTVGSSRPASQGITYIIGTAQTSTSEMM